MPGARGCGRTIRGRSKGSRPRSPPRRAPQGRRSRSRSRLPQTGIRSDSRRRQTGRHRDYLARADGKLDQGTHRHAGARGRRARAAGRRAERAHRSRGDVLCRRVRVPQRVRSVELERPATPRRWRRFPTSSVVAVGPRHHRSRHSASVEAFASSQERNVEYDVPTAVTLEDAGYTRQPPARTYVVRLDAGLQSARDGQTLGYDWTDWSRTGTSGRLRASAMATAYGNRAPASLCRFTHATSSA